MYFTIKLLPLVFFFLCFSPGVFIEWGGLTMDLQSEIEYSEAMNQLANRSGIFNPLLAFTDIPEVSKLFNDSDSKDKIIEMKLLKVAFFVRFHKFTTVDPRKYENILESIRSKNLHQRFPNQKIKLHEKIADHCKRSFLSCLFRIDEVTNDDVIKVTLDKPTVDLVGPKYCGGTSDEKLFCPVPRDKEISLSSSSYCKDKHLESTSLWPVMDRFRFVTTAMYFMCWYTLHKVPYLANIAQCDSRYHCEHPEDTDGDIRANPMVPFACALHSFCPDPCCKLAFSHEKRICENLPSNPCRLNNPPNKRQCKIDLNGNKDFNRLTQNQINLTCICHSAGEIYSVLAKECVDRDECAENIKLCESRTEECFNTRGSYLCICKWGFHYDAKAEKCARRPSIEMLRMHHLQKLNYNASLLKTTHALSRTNVLHKDYTSIPQRVFQLVVFSVQKIISFFSSLTSKIKILLTEIALVVQQVADYFKWELRSDAEIKTLKHRNVKDILLIKLDTASILANMTDEQRLAIKAEND